MHIQINPPISAEMTATYFSAKVHGLKVTIIEDFNARLYILTVTAGKHEVFSYWSVNYGHIAQIAMLILKVAARTGKAHALRTLNSIILQPFIEAPALQTSFFPLFDDPISAGLWL